MANDVRGLVYAKFRSLRGLAKATGWDRTKACDIVNGKREPRVSEVKDLARALEMPAIEVAAIFLR